MLPPLATAGNRILSLRTGEPLLLRGVNLSGMEYSSERCAGLTAAEADCIVKGWRSNIVRLPFVQSLVLSGDGRDYVAELQEMVEMFATRGAYSILDLQWLDRDKVWGPGDNRVPPQPDEGTLFCWELLSHSFRGVPHVIFDLFNEPHDISLTQWLGWASRITERIRAIDPDRVVMVGGLDWAYDLRDIVIPFANVIYSTHVYANKRPGWSAAFGEIALTRPVFAGEWGGEAKDLAWGRRLAAYFRELGIGWTAWSWRDWPHLQKDGIATPFGQIVAEELESGSSAILDGIPLPTP